MYLGGVTAKTILRAMYIAGEYDYIIKEFEDKYLEHGADVLEISYEQNVSFEYVGNGEIHFYFIKEKNGKAGFDVYIVE